MAESEVKITPIPARIAALGALILNIFTVFMIRGNWQQFRADHNEIVGGSPTILPGRIKAYLGR